ncbi:hypothetical protein MATL_G00245940 [Megalops atlanticus]|uniref:TM7S3/TM198-like domain-containing protein n=1 Tax=Megalops atlanticus TaxID=7932 RepID=A0A9D3T0S0_MEGAT|nr:hypothetical protein MATL_G00245940 [Megalops atlanticus]
MFLFWTLPVMLLILTWDGVLSQDANRVVFSLGKFQNLTVPPNATLQVVVSRIPWEVTHITLQFHTQRRNTTLSYKKIPTPDSANTAVDSGLLSPLFPWQNFLTWYLLSPDDDPVAGTGVILPYKHRDPVPGGCNLEYDLTIDPNIYLHYNLFKTTIHFAPANIGYARGATLPACNVSQWRLEYDIYRFYLPTGDYSERTLLFYIEKAASVQSLTDYGEKLATLSSSEETSMTINSVAGQGVIYSVVARDTTLNTSASYIPVHTYSCSFSSVLDDCLSMGRISTKVFFTLGGLAGLFVCFFGHRFFKCELFCMGFAFTGLIFFVLITRTTLLDYDMRLTLTAVMGVVGGVLLVLSWWRFGSVMACVIVVGLILGFLVASIIFYTPLGDLAVFRSSVVFWVTFSCIVLVVPLIFVRWPREGNITTCGVAGAYAVVLAVNAYVSTSLAYITLDILKRFLNINFNRDFISVPLQDIDFGMITVWVVLSVSGTVLQLCRERERPFFPPSPYLMWRQARERRKTNVLDPSHHVPPLPGRLRARLQGMFRKSEPADEQTPLLL